MLIFELNFNFYALHLQVQVLHLCSVLQHPQCAALQNRNKK